MQRQGLDERVRRWQLADPDPETRAELDQLAEHDRDALAARFAGRLEFGTAGLRGPLGGGPLAMNRVVVRLAARALVDHLQAGWRDAQPPLVVIGFDARKNSDVFAADTAAVVAAAGARALLLPGPLPTPVLAFAVRARRAAAGVMVTASHNPPHDNGYKVYLADGAQLVPPHDRDIETRIEHLDFLPRTLPAPAPGGAVETCADDIVGEYLDAVLRAPAPRSSAIAGLRIAYTPLHGVGRAAFERALARVGARAEVVAAQADPDATFPTVAFPNPEEPGALDLGLDLARQMGADVLVAHDPDADRLAVALPVAGGDWRVLSGNEIGALLGEYRLRTTRGADRLTAASLVSSSLLGKMAAAAGVHHVETLTGFKWIVRPAIDDPSRHFVFGFEEALGFATNDVVRDKDGITAAMTFLEMLAELRQKDMTPFDVLDDLARRFGRHASAQRSIRFDGAAALGAMTAALAALRAAPPRAIGGREIVSTTDYAVHEPPADIVRYDLTGGARVMLRPSGTEPKLKVYVEVVSDLGDDEARAATDARAAAAADPFA